MESVEPTTEKTSDSNSASLWTLVYDEQCFFCRTLASLLTGPTLSWQRFIKLGPTGEESLAPERHEIPPPQDIFLIRMHSNEQGGQTIHDMVDWRNPDNVITGQAAWRFLLSSEPALSRWLWLGKRLGIDDDVTTAGIRTTAHFMRKTILRFCPRCHHQNHRMKASKS